MLQRGIEAGERQGVPAGCQPQQRQVHGGRRQVRVDRQGALERLLGCGAVAQFAERVALLEGDLGGARRQGAGERAQGGQRRRRLAAPRLAGRDKQLRIAEARGQRQRPLQRRLRVGGPAKLEVLHAQFVMGERAGGMVLDLFEADAQVGFGLGADQRGVGGLAEMVDDPRAAPLGQRPRRVGGHELFVHGVVEPQRGPVAKQPAALDVDEPVVRRAFVVAAGAGCPPCHRAGREVVALDGEDGVGGRRPDHPADDVAIARGDGLIGVDRQDPVARRLGDAVVARQAEVVLPGTLERAGAERPGDLERAIRAAGIDDDELVRERPYGLEAAREVCLLVPDDQAYAERRSPGAGRFPAPAHRSSRAAISIERPSLRPDPFPVTRSIGFRFMSSTISVRAP